MRVRTSKQTRRRCTQLDAAGPLRDRSRRWERWSRRSDARRRSDLFRDDIDVSASEASGALVGPDELDAVVAAVPSVGEDLPGGDEHFSPRGPGVGRRPPGVEPGDGDYPTFRALLEQLELPPGVRMATTHCGAAFRERFEPYNRLDAKLGFSVRFVAPDLYRLGQSCRVPTVPMLNSCDTLVPVEPLPADDGRVRISHSPSDRKKKGSELIIGVLERFAERAEIDVIESVSHAECLARRARSQIFIDQLQPAIGGYGVSSIEALAQGCAVLCDYRNVVDDVWSFFPRPPIAQVGSAEQLERAIEQLLDDSAELQRRRCESVAWARANTTPEAVARYYLRHLEGRKPASEDAAAPAARGA